MMVRCNGLRAVPVPLVHSKQVGCVAVLLICCSVDVEPKQGVCHVDIYLQLINLLDGFRGSSGIRERGDMKAKSYVDVRVEHRSIPTPVSLAVNVDV
jgi:hypothetical protein